MDKLTFSDLIDIHSLQMTLDCFAEYTGLALCVADSDGRLIGRPSGETEFCDGLTKCSKEGLARCNECDRNGILRALGERKAIFYTCHAGMTDFLIPVLFENRIIGGIMAGKVRTDEFDEEQFRKTAQELGIDPDRYVKAAKEVPYLSKEQAAATTRFLSGFAESLSAMAHANYQKIAELQKTERIARSQSAFITGLTEDLRSSMQEWIHSFRSTTEKYNDIPEITEETTPILNKSLAVYSSIQGAVDYIRMSGGSAEFTESAYEVRQLLESVAATLKQEAADTGITITTDFSPELPQTLIGNSGRIGQIVSHLAIGLVNFTPADGQVTLSAACRSTDYSCLLMLRIAGKGTRMTEKAAESIRQLIQNGVDVINPDRKATSRDIDFPLVILLLRQMSGHMQAESLTDGNVVFDLTIPQLDGSKQSA